VRSATEILDRGGPIDVSDALLMFRSVATCYHREADQ
jgi:hypothetical protein